MTDLELRLRLSLIQNELRQLSSQVGPEVAKILERAANLLNLVTAEKAQCPRL